MSDPRRQVTASSSSNRPPISVAPAHEDNESDITWLNFLRTSGGSLAPPEAASIVRKRRHSRSSPERRSPSYDPTLTVPKRQSPQQPSGFRNTGNPSGQVARTRMANPPGEMGSNGGPRDGPETHRRDSEVTTPLWQPDSAVDHCPVCQTEFSFWYRKHHCRKCGRVVCSACSPHRITIPRQYIVQPSAWRSSDSTPSPQQSSDFDSNPALGGGEIVRVCNPCVPDPWTPSALPQSTGEQSTTQEERQRRRDHRTVDARTQNVERAVQFHADLDTISGASRRDSLNVRRAGDPRADFNRTYDLQRASAHRRQLSNVESWSRPPPDIQRPGERRAQAVFPRSHRHSVSNSTPPVRPPIESGQRTSLGPAPVPFNLPRPPPVPRRQVREEDECPVCGCEMPPGEGIREEHIRECITTRFSSTPSQVGSLPHPPPQASPTGVRAAPAITDPSLQNRPRASSYRPRGMAVYKATEKDCSNAEGDIQECVICFEEFQPGDELGRMECLCKFHRTCIRQWWETKGHGSCPTHQLHE